MPMPKRETASPYKAPGNSVAVGRQGGTRAFRPMTAAAMQGVQANAS